ncbi:10047_t:CDS:2, partial [Entrophospora sp. SA101]
QKFYQEFTEGIIVDRNFLRPVIEGNPWFFISDPTHVFKKLCNNLSKCYTRQDDEKYCHIWLTPWSKMHVDLAEQTLSKDVENALEVIEELNDISEGKSESKRL